MMTTSLEQGSSKVLDSIVSHSRFPMHKIGAPLLAVIQSASDGVVIIDATRHIVLVNNRAEQMFGYSGKQLLDRPIDMILPPRISVEQRRRIERFAAIRMSGRRTRLSFRGIRANGDEFPLHAAISRVTMHGEMFLVAILQPMKTGNSCTIQTDSRRHLMRSSELRRLVASTQQAHEIEKRRFSRELYDDIGQRLSVLKLDLDWLENRLPDTDRCFPERMAEMRGLLDNVITLTRSMASNLRPPLLDDFGLLPAVEWMTENFRKRNGVQCVFRASGDASDLPETVESAVFRVIQEGLLNVEKHARASRVEVTLECTDDILRVTIEDNGIGMGADSQNKPGCYGLIAMQERIFVLGGTIAIRSARPQGVAIHVSIPIDSLPIQ